MKRTICILSVVVLLSSCATTQNQLNRQSEYSGFYDEKPLTLLVMPPINNSTNVEAKDLLYTSISRPLIEAGYYVIPPLLAMDVFKGESAYDSELFIDGSLKMFREYFGADAVIFSVIDKWSKKGFGIETKIRYVIKSTTTNEVLFERSCDLYLNLQQNSGSASPFGQLMDLAVSAINTAATDHIIAARKANYYIFKDIPRGKYNPDYMNDKQVIVGKKDISATVQ